MSGLLIRLDHTTYRRLLREASRERTTPSEVASQILKETLNIRENSRRLANVIVSDT